MLGCLQCDSNLKSMGSRAACDEHFALRGGVFAAAALGLYQHGKYQKKAHVTGFHQFYCIFDALKEFELLQSLVVTGHVASTCWFSIHRHVVIQPNVWMLRRGRSM